MVLPKTEAAAWQPWLAWNNLISNVMYHWLSQYKNQPVDTLLDPTSSDFVY